VIHTLKHNAKVKLPRWTFSGNALLCALAVVTFVLACRANVEMGYIDDWSYVRSARVFAATGHIVYNGWAGPTLGWQLLWAVPFIKLFGSSYTVLRFSLLPIVFLTVYLFHHCLLRFRLTEMNATFGALTLGLSPFFLPVASSFMTDIPSLMVVILCLFLCQKAMAATTNRGAIFWVIAAALTNLAGGTVRQIAWLGVLLIVPSVGWRLRSRRGVAAVAFSAAAISSVCIFAFLRWYDAQPYSVPEKVFIFSLSGPVLTHLFGQYLNMFLFLLLAVLPILAAFLCAMLRLSLRIFWSIYFSLAAFVLLASIAIRKSGLLGIVQTSYGIHWALPAEAVFLGVMAILFVVIRRTGGGKKSPRMQEPASRSSYWDVLWLLGPYTLGYLALLIPRGATGTLLDRYVLGLTPLPIVFLLKIYQDRVGTAMPKIAFAVLAILAFFGVGKADKRYAENRARLKAVNILLAHNVPRTAIYNGFEYDCETQLDTTGYINEPKIEVPAGAYHPYTPTVPFPAAALDPTLTPSVVPEYYLVTSPEPYLVPTSYPPIEYRTLLPPFDRRIYIEQLRSTAARERQFKSAARAVTPSKVVATLGSVSAMANYALTVK
jgi:hypothetical protein